MKAGIITFHFPYNCGAVLQCLALQTQLEKLGAQAFVINYKPWYHQNRYTPVKNPVYYAGKLLHKPAPGDTQKTLLRRAAGGFARTVYSWRKYGEMAPRDRAFSQFRKRYLHETRVYRTLGTLKRRPPEADLYIAGSDQLWNVKLTDNQPDHAYFLDFGNDRVHRYTFSIGVFLTGTQEEKQELSGLLKRFQTISLREETYLPAIREASGGAIPLRQDLDPTFLLTAEEYEPYLCKRTLETEPFILTYTMPNKSQLSVYITAKRLAKKKGIKIIDISGNPNDSHKYIPDNRTSGPDEFLWYVKHAQYVVTNSFHGTAFSVIFRKQFTVIPHTITGNRVSDLLKRLSLQDRVRTSPDDANGVWDRAIDYTATEQALDQLRAESREYLRGCVSQN